MIAMSEKQFRPRSSDFMYWQAVEVNKVVDQEYAQAVFQPRVKNFQLETYQYLSRDFIGNNQSFPERSQIAQEVIHEMDEFFSDQVAKLSNSRLPQVGGQLDTASFTYLSSHASFNEISGEFTGAPTLYQRITLEDAILHYCDQNKVIALLEDYYTRDRACRLIVRKLNKFKDLFENDARRLLTDSFIARIISECSETTVKKVLQSTYVSLFMDSEIVFKALQSSTNPLLKTEFNTDVSHLTFYDNLMKLLSGNTNDQNYMFLIQKLMALKLNQDITRLNSTPTTFHPLINFFTVHLPESKTAIYKDYLSLNMSPVDAILAENVPLDCDMIQVLTERYINRLVDGKTQLWELIRKNETTSIKLKRYSFERITILHAKLMESFQTINKTKQDEADSMKFVMSENHYPGAER
jgi:hypothetical protein